MTEESAYPGWSDITRSVARYISWSPDRRVPVERWEAPLREGGFEVHEAARRFLAEFGGLGTDDWTPGPYLPQSPFRFDPRGAAGERERFARWSREAGASVCPIGFADSGDSFLGMTPDGAVWVGRERAERLADSAYEALEKLVVERRTDAPLPFVPGDGRLVLPHRPEHDSSAEIGTRWSAETDRELRLAGWFPGRAVETGGWERGLSESDEGFVMHEAARRFLAEFGGLGFRLKGPGRTMVRVPFRLDPLLARWDFEIIEMQGEEMGRYLYPLGDVHRGNFYLTMAADGTVYMGLDYPRVLAGSGDEALDKLIVGIA